MINLKVKINTIVFSVAIISAYLLQRFGQDNLGIFIRKNNFGAISLLVPIIYCLYVFFTWKNSEKSLMLGMVASFVSCVYVIILVLFAMEFSVCLGFGTYMIAVLSGAEFITRRGIEEVTKEER